MTRRDFWIGCAVAFSGQVGSLFGVAVIERGPADWLDWIATLMVPFGLTAFVVGIGLVMGWWRLYKVTPR